MDRIVRRFGRRFYYVEETAIMWQFFIAFMLHSVEGRLYFYETHFLTAVKYNSEFVMIESRAVQVTVRKVTFLEIFCYHIPGSDVGVCDFVRCYCRRMGCRN